MDISIIFPYNRDGDTMKKRILIGIGLAAILFIWLNSFIQGDTSNTISYYVTDFIVTTFNLDVQFHMAHVFVRKAAHVLEYTALGGILYLIIASRFSKYAFIYSFMLATLVACFDEMIQYFNVDRLGQISDVLLDCVGILIGLLIGWSIKKVRSRTSK